MKVFKKVGFESMGYSTGSSEEAQAQQLLVGSTQAQQKEQPSSSTLQDESMISTVVYKLVDDTEIHADICVPKAPPAKPIPIGECPDGSKPNDMLIESHL